MPIIGMSDFLECHEYLLFVMDLGVRARLRYQAALIQARLNLNVANINLIAVERRRRRRQRRWWTRPWLSPERRRSFGLYDQLMTELRREDRQSFLHWLPSNAHRDVRRDIAGWTSHSQAEFFSQKSTGTRTQVSNYTRICAPVLIQEPLSF